MNVMFEIAYINYELFSQQRKGPELWSTFKNFSAQRDVNYHHNIESGCFDRMRVKFVSKDDFLANRPRKKTFLYSPLIPLNDGFYIIYEVELLGNLEYYYAYILKTVGDSFKFERRDYFGDTFWKVKEDYMKTVDFESGYEDFITK